jgi:predicted ArsR family transcriptional regulator
MTAKPELTMSRNERIRRLLREGPSTTEEIAASLDIPRRSAQIGVWVLQSIAHVQSDRRRVPNERNWPLKLYRLTPRGLHYVATGPEDYRA